MTVLEPHLDVDQLSAAVDGDGGPAVTAHLASCAACRDQLGAWRRALAPLQRPVAPLRAAAHRDPVGAALAAWDGGGSGGTPPAVPGDGAGATPAGGVAAAPPRRRVPPRRVPPRRLTAVLGAAAAVAAVAGLVVLGHPGGSATSSSGAGSAATGAAPAARGASSSGGSGYAGSGTAAGAGRAGLPDLGPIGSPSTLAAALRPLLGSPSGTAAGGDGGGAVTPVEPPCLHQADLAAGVDGPAAAAARLLWHGGEAYVLVLRLPAGGDVAEVVSTGCQLLSTVPLGRP